MKEAFFFFFFFFKSEFIFRSVYNVAQRRSRRVSTRYDWTCMGSEKDNYETIYGWSKDYVEWYE